MASYQRHPLSWVHCNKCFTLLIQKFQQLFLSNCQHVLCATCIVRDKPTNTPQCPVCKIEIKLQPIDNHMSEQCKMLFHPRPLEDQRNWVNVIRFQSKQRKNLSRAFAIAELKLQQAEKLLADLKSDVKSVIKKRDGFRNQRAILEKHLNSLKEEYRKKSDGSVTSSMYSGRA